MQSRLRWHEGDGFGRHVGDVGGDDVDASAQRRRQRVVQVALVDGPAGQVATRARHGDGIEFGRVQDDVPDLGRDQGADGPRPAAQVEDGRRAPGDQRRELDRLSGKEFRAPARDEHPVIDCNAQAAELGPAEDVLERRADDPPLDEGIELGRAPRGGAEQRRLVLGEDASGRPQRRDDVREIVARAVLVAQCEIFVRVSRQLGPCGALTCCVLHNSLWLVAVQYRNVNV